MTEAAELGTKNILSTLLHFFKNFFWFFFYPDSSEVKALIAALSFIVSNVAKYNVEDDIVRNELQQFGLPKGLLFFNRQLQNQSILLIYQKYRTL